MRPQVRAQRLPCVPRGPVVKPESSWAPRTTYHSCAWQAELEIEEYGDNESANAMGFALNGVAFQFANQIQAHRARRTASEHIAPLTSRGSTERSAADMLWMHAAPRRAAVRRVYRSLCEGNEISAGASGGDVDGAADGALRGGLTKNQVVAVV